MASTYTTNLGIEKIQTGQQAGQWGDTTNTNFDIIDQAVNGIVTVTLTSAGTSGSPNDIPITDGAESDGRNKFIRLYSASDLGSTVYVRITPSDAEKIVHIRNDLNTQNAVIFQGNYDAGRSIGVTNGRDVLLKFDGGGDGAATVADVNNDLGVTKITAATVDINGGNIDGTTIGGTTPAAGTFTALKSTGFLDASTVSDPNEEIMTLSGSESGSNVSLYLENNGGYTTTFGLNESGTAGLSLFSTVVRLQNASSGTFLSHADGADALTSTATTFTCSGFTSTGIDDNATATVVTVAGGSSGDNSIIQGVNANQKSGFYGVSDNFGFEISDGGVGGKTVRIRNNGANIFSHNQVQDIIDMSGAASVTVAGFTSTGIDDNATSTAITISSSEQVGIGTASPSADLHVYEAASLGTAAANMRIEAENTTYSSATLVITNNDDTITLSCDNGNTPSGKIGAYVRLQGLPTSDPSVAGQVWNDSGTLKISAG